MMFLRPVLALLLAFLLLAAAEPLNMVTGPQQTLWIAPQQSHDLQELVDLVGAAVDRNSGGLCWLESTIVIRPPTEDLSAFVDLGLGNYDRIILLLHTDTPRQPIGTIGKRDLPDGGVASVAWIYIPDGASLEDVERAVLHELGHGFGFLHAGPASDPYNDPDDIMGCGYEWYAPRWRRQAGWLK